MAVEEENFNKLLQVVPNLKHLREYAKLVAPGFMDLGVDVLERHQGKLRVALSHYYKHESGDLIADPDMELEVDFVARTVRAMTFQDSMLYQEAEGNCALQGELNRFLSFTVPM